MPRNMNYNKVLHNFNSDKFDIQRERDMDEEEFLGFISFQQCQQQLQTILLIAGSVSSFQINSRQLDGILSLKVDYPEVPLYLQEKWNFFSCLLQYCVFLFFLFLKNRQASDNFWYKLLIKSVKSDVRLLIWKIDDKYLIFFQVIFFFFFRHLKSV